MYLDCSAMHICFTLLSQPKLGQMEVMISLALVCCLPVCQQDYAKTHRRICVNILTRGRAWPYPHMTWTGWWTPEFLQLFDWKCHLHVGRGLQSPSRFWPLVALWSRVLRGSYCAVPQGYRQVIACNFSDRCTQSIVYFLNAFFTLCNVC